MSLEHLDAIQTGLLVPGLKVLDTSFIAGARYHKVHANFTGKEEELQENLEFCQRVHDMEIAGQLLVPEEVINELLTRSTKLKNYAKKLRKNFQKHYPHGKAAKGSGGMSPQYIRDEATSLANTAMRLDSVKNKLYSKLRTFNLESHIAPEIMPFLPNITEAFRDIHRVSEKKIAALFPHFERNGLVQNKGNDGAIMAKAFALSYSQGVHLLTADRGYIYQSRIFYSDPNGFAERYGFSKANNSELPIHAVNVLFRRDNSLVIDRPGWGEWEDYIPEKQN